MTIYKRIFSHKQGSKKSAFAVKASERLIPQIKWVFRAFFAHWDLYIWKFVKKRHAERKESSHVKPYVQAHKAEMPSPYVNRKSICILVALYLNPTPSGKSVFSSIRAHTLCLCLLNKKKGSPSTILMMDWWMKDVCENSQHLFAPLSSQCAAPIPHA